VEESVTVFQEYLGLKPFVLIEIDEIHDDEAIEFRVRAGGGIEDRADVREVLAATLESLQEGDT